MEARITELEIKLSLGEDHLEVLNRSVFRQQQQIDLLTREVGHLRQQTPDDGAPVFRSLRDELPPHY